MQLERRVRGGMGTRVDYSFSVTLLDESAKSVGLSLSLSPAGCVGRPDWQHEPPAKSFFKA